MTNNKHYDKLKSIVSKCDRCGACTTVCPLYQVDRKDRAAARGKIAIVRAFMEGKLDGGEKALREALDYCLLCKACVENCPGKVMTDEAMMEIRQWLAEEHGQSVKYKLVGSGLASRPLKVLGKPAMGIARGMKFPKLTRGLLPDSHANTIAHRGPALLHTPDTTKNGIDLAQVKTIGYFKGCAMKLFFPDASAASIALLEKTERTVEVPEVDCCGLPQQAHGMTDLTKKLARRNIDALEKYDLIISDCGSCSSMLKEYAKLFEGDFTIEARAKALSQKVMGLSEYLYAVGYEPVPHKELRVTYHSSCHLNRGQGILKEPQTLLEKAVTYLPAEKGTMCCGGSGTFQIDFPATSNKVLNAKCEDFEKTGADIVVAECPSCLMQLGKLEHRSKLKVMHISQVL